MLDLVALTSLASARLGAIGDQDKAPAMAASAAGLGQAWQQKNEQVAQSMAAQEMKTRGFKNWQ